MFRSGYKTSKYIFLSIHRKLGWDGKKPGLPGCVSVGCSCSAASFWGSAFGLMAAGILGALLQGSSA